MQAILVGISILLTQASSTTDVPLTDEMKAYLAQHNLKLFLILQSTNIPIEQKIEYINTLMV